MAHPYRRHSLETSDSKQINFSMVFSSVNGNFYFQVIATSTSELSVSFEFAINFLLAKSNLSTRFLFYPVNNLFHFITGFLIEYKTILI